jgi:hypothetical protein
MTECVVGPAHVTRGINGDMTEEHKNEFGVFEQRGENDVGAH